MAAVFQDGNDVTNLRCACGTLAFPEFIRPSEGKETVCVQESHREPRVLVKRDVEEFRERAEGADGSLWMIDHFYFREQIVTHESQVSDVRLGFESDHFPYKYSFGSFFACPNLPAP